MKTHVSSRGYYKLILRRAGEKTTANVHRLVCEAFHGPAPEGKPLACHKDGDALNNRAENLYWGSLSDNMRDSVRHGTHPNARKTHCKRGHKLPDATEKGRKCPTCARDSAREALSRNRKIELAADDPRHGTVNLYTTYGCRCDRCRRAIATSSRKNRDSKPPLAADDPRHGTRGGYTNCRCRCEPCRDAEREYSRNRKR